jgi:hypothetical protein
LEILLWHITHIEKLKGCRTGNEHLFKKQFDESLFKYYDLQIYQKHEE